MVQVESSKLWTSNEQLALNAQHKIAAVAYVSDDSLIRFARGDMLIVDASDEHIASGATSAAVLAAAVSRGAKVYSLPSLHAKLMVFDNHVVIGSANISASSASGLRGAGVISDSPALISNVLSLINNLKNGSKRVNDRFLKRISRIIVQRKKELPQKKKQGVTARKPTVLDALQANSPHLQDFVFLLVEGKATLTDIRIRKVAKKQNKKIPPTDKWEWYEFDAVDRGNYFDNLFQKLFVNQRLKILHFIAEIKDNSVQRVIELLSLQPCLHQPPTRRQENCVQLRYGLSNPIQVGR
jgi:phosphatidylserine/phosphatidylglycerophosphate/cardiolipin synthase-like enzyme